MSSRGCLRTIVWVSKLCIAKHEDGFPNFWTFHKFDEVFFLVVPKWSKSYRSHKGFHWNKCVSFSRFWMPNCCILWFGLPPFKTGLNILLHDTALYMPYHAITQVCGLPPEEAGKWDGILLGDVRPHPYRLKRRCSRPHFILTADCVAARSHPSTLHPPTVSHPAPSPPSPPPLLAAFGEGMRAASHTQVGREQNKRKNFRICRNQHWAEFLNCFHSMYRCCWQREGKGEDRKRTRER